ncbi:PP2C family protein-serine/threonine phosphatase [Streptomyces sulfonofaciens]|uniref:PP2C family protein-serine/threonine phosphatase n=1 Tax=Streptomyces sulfonofaciens TaxID=68272 RepID=UPI001E5E0FC3|nr:PP2C family protein-serine/threonine phosphatase [Streptomyces sulfonofaciens]
MPSRGATRHRASVAQPLRPTLVTTLFAPVRPLPGRALPGTGGGLAPDAGRWARLMRQLVRLSPWLIVLGGLLFDALLPVKYSAVPIFVAAPLIAAPFYRPHAVIVIGAIALTGTLVRNAERMTIDNANGITQLVTCFVVSLLALLINRVVQRGYTMLTSARQVATAVQRAVLPEPPERLAGLEVAARYEAAQAEAFIGGDLYAVQDTPHGVRVVVGDVRGKGLGAVAAVAVLIGAFREAAEQESSLEAVAQRLDRALARETAIRQGPEGFEEFATAVFAEIPHGRDVVRVVNRGHPWPLALYADGALREVAACDAALPLGMSDLGAWPPQARDVPFPRGATLLMYTDGVTEARNAHGTFYDPVASLRGRVFGGPDDLLSVVTGEVRRHTGDGGTDDLALLAVRRP